MHHVGPNGSNEFRPYTVPYTGSGAVRVGDHYVPSSQVVGGSAKASGQFPEAPQASSSNPGSTSPPQACVSSTYHGQSAGQAGQNTNAQSLVTTPAVRPCRQPCLRISMSCIFEEATAVAAAITPPSPATDALSTEKTVRDQSLRTLEDVIAPANERVHLGGAVPRRGRGYAGHASLVVSTESP